MAIINKIVRDSTETFFSGGVGSIVPMRFGKQSQRSGADTRWLDLWHAERNKLWEKIRRFDAKDCAETFRLGDRLGAPWETGEVNWSPVSREQIMHRSNEHSKGTDESDIIDCFDAYTAQYEYDGNRERFLVSWADFHEKHRRYTTYGGTWKGYFNAVKYLRKKDRLNLETLYLYARECKPDGGSTGNGFYALVLPVYAYALIVEEDPHELVRDVVTLTHAHPTAISCALFLTHLFDIVRGVIDESSIFDCSLTIERYYGRDSATTFDDPHNWQRTPEEFARVFPDNILCCNTLAHALFAIHSAEDEQDLVSKVVGLSGDVDSVLGLALMLYRMFYTASRREIAFARGQLTNLETSELYDFDWWRGWYF